MHVTDCVEWAVASLGKGGTHDSNAERDLHRWVANLFDSQLEKYPLKVEVIIVMFYGMGPWPGPDSPIRATSKSAHLAASWLGHHKTCDWLPHSGFGAGFNVSVM